MPMCSNNPKTHVPMRPCRGQRRKQLRPRPKPPLQAPRGPKGVQQLTQTAILSPILPYPTVCRVRRKAWTRAGLGREQWGSVSIHIHVFMSFSCDRSVPIGACICRGCKTSLKNPSHSMHPCIPCVARGGEVVESMFFLCGPVSLDISTCIGQPGNVVSLVSLGM